MMEPKDQILEELNAFLDDAENARDVYYAKAVRLASLVARNSATIAKCKIDEDIRAFIEADKRYTKALVAATSARARLSRFLETVPKGGAK